MNSRSWVDPHLFSSSMKINSDKLVAAGFDWKYGELFACSQQGDAFVCTDTNVLKLIRCCTGLLQQGAAELQRLYVVATYNEALASQV